MSFRNSDSARSLSPNRMYVIPRFMCRNGRLGLTVAASSNSVFASATSKRLRNAFPKIKWYSAVRSEEHTSELQSRGHLVCRLLLEKKKKKNNIISQEERKKTRQIL